MWKAVGAGGVRTRRGLVPVVVGCVLVPLHEVEGVCSCNARSREHGSAADQEVRRGCLRLISWPERRGGGQHAGRATPGTQPRGGAPSHRKRRRCPDVFGGSVGTCRPSLRTRPDLVWRTSSAAGSRGVAVPAGRPVGGAELGARRTGRPARSAAGRGAGVDGSPRTAQAGLEDIAWSASSRRETSATVAP